MFIISPENQEKIIKGIQPQRVTLLREMDVGDPAGEDDRLLDSCQIETLPFEDLFNDKKDLIVGPKGSGKSSLYMLFTKYMRPVMLRSNRTCVIRGVAKVGAPIYAEYSSEFANFKYQDFQNFWNILFINLIYRDFVRDKDLFDPTQVEKFRSLCCNSGVLLSEDSEDSNILKNSIERAKKIKGGASVGPTGAAANLEVELSEDEAPTLERPSDLKTTGIFAFILDYLEKYDFKIWIFLDQLDQAFIRLSKVERRALHALIFESLAFNRERLKLKIFLREDIFELVNNYRGIVNSDHLRISDSLRWEEIDLLRLILKRLLYNSDLRGFFSLMISGLEEIDDMSMEHCKFVLYTLFPAKAKKGADTWDYLLRELRDGKGNVTPRDLISFVDHAKTAQIKILSAGELNPRLFSNQSIETALEKCSEAKIIHYVNAEFPYVKDVVDKLKYKQNKYDETQLREVLGVNGFKTRMKQLLSVGVLQQKGEGTTIWVAPIYQRGLKVTQRRTKKTANA